MLLHECKDKLNIGDIVYICDYRFNDIDNQPIRHIPPMKVVVCSNEDLPKNKRVYYSEVHFRPIGTNGKVQSRIIAPFDNTGYRAYTGTSLNIFYDEQKSKDFYRTQCKENIKRFNEAKVNKVAYYDKKIEEINKEMESL
ncbi:hypothetical protein GCM10023310_69020 [Paenibacillus vulneris]|uniref:Type II toxin-antitoxin system PemK/MazF family toxin n=1 Tax=Paenibacillus vulneris TaxID=1133364 RepID=A0ABW3UG37_9BACL